MPLRKDALRDIAILKPRRNPSRTPALSHTCVENAPCVRSDPGGFRTGLAVAPALVIGIVGMDFESPLERMAADAGAPGDVTAIPAPLGSQAQEPTSVHAWVHALAHACKDDSGTRRERRETLRASGYARSVTDPRRWA